MFYLRKFNFKLVKRSEVVKSSVTLIPYGGLANRMKAIEALIVLTQDTDISATAIWFKDQGLNCSFEQLFQPLKIPRLTLRNAILTDYILNDRPQKRISLFRTCFKKYVSAVVCMKTRSHKEHTGISIFADGHCPIKNLICRHACNFIPVTDKEVLHLSALSRICRSKSMKNVKISQRIPWASISAAPIISFPSKKALRNYSSCG